MANKKLNKISELAETNRANLKKEKLLADIAELMISRGIDPKDVGEIKKISYLKSVFKDEDGTEGKISISLAPSWDSGPAWPVVDRGPSIQLPKSTTKPKANNEFETCIIVPDIQIGFYRNEKGDLEPTHDEKALSIALMVIKEHQPKLIVCVGDNLDLPEMGKYLTYPAYAQTTQASIDRAALFCAEMRAAAPHSRIVWLAGNHEERMPKYLLVNAGAAYGLRKGNTPASWPVLSVPYLCRMDEYKVEYKPGYPASDIWINKKLRVIHGDKVRSNGSTAHMYLDSEKTSVIFGHIHRIEQAFKTREDYDGSRTIMAASPGCLSRIDGAIPSTKGGVDLDGRPLTRFENWQQGLAVVKYEEKGKHRFSYENIAIYDGWAMYNGKEYTAGE